MFFEHCRHGCAHLLSHAQPLHPLLVHTTYLDRPMLPGWERCRHAAWREGGAWFPCSGRKAEGARRCLVQTIDSQHRLVLPNEGKGPNDTLSQNGYGHIYIY